jgi:anti-sigma factor RsiW
MVRAAGRVRCDQALPALLEDGDVIPLAARAHLRGCPRCRGALARHRALQVELRRLEQAPAPGESGPDTEALVAAILAGLDAEDRRHSRRAMWIGRCALAGGVAAGVAAGIVAAARNRRPALAL